MDSESISKENIFISDTYKFTLVNSFYGELVACILMRRSIKFCQ